MIYNTIRLRFTVCTTDIERVSLWIDGKVYRAEDFTATGTVGADGLPIYEVQTDPIPASMLEHIYSLRLYVDGVQCQAYSYGFVSYLYTAQNSTDQVLLDLIRAIRNYGLSAVAYRDAMGQ